MEPDPPIMGLSFPQQFGLAGHFGLPCGLTTLPYPRPFAFYTFNFHQPNKLLVSHAHTFYYTFITLSQTISELCILTIKFTFSKKGKYHSLQFGSTCNWSPLWAYNTAISMTLFLSAIHSFHSQTNCQSLMHPCTYISIFKTMHTNSSSHLYKYEKGVPFLAYASFKHTKPFKMYFNISNDLTNVPVLIATFIPNALFH